MNWYKNVREFSQTSDIIRIQGMQALENAVNLIHILFWYFSFACLQGESFSFSPCGFGEIGFEGHRPQQSSAQVK